MSGEFERIREWLLPLGQPPSSIADLQSQVLLNNGDDAFAVFTQQPLIVSVDMAVAGTHFPVGASAQHVASKALRSALSDLAAMGARPWFYTLALQIPSSLSEAWWAEFSRQLQSENELWGVQCLGGDLVAGEPLTLSVQVHGLGQAILRRSDAQVGDTLWLTGSVGGAAVGLQQILRGETPAAPLLDAFYAPQLPLRWMHHVAPQVHAAIDVSDGLLADLTHLLSASGVGAEIDLEQLPLTSGVPMAHPSDWVLPLTGGDDYQVLFTAPESARADLLETAQAMHQAITPIGRIRQALGYDLLLHGQPFAMPNLPRGYNHFE
jgi:thiamine-monophosphate kinase